MLTTQTDNLQKQVFNAIHLTYGNYFGYDLPDEIIEFTEFVADEISKVNRNVDRKQWAWSALYKYTILDDISIRTVNLVIIKVLQDAINRGDIK